MGEGRPVEETVVPLEELTTNDIVEEATQVRLPQILVPFDN